MTEQPLAQRVPFHPLLRPCRSAHRGDVVGEEVAGGLDGGRLGHPCPQDLVLPAVPGAERDPAIVAAQEGSVLLAALEATSPVAGPEQVPVSVTHRVTGRLLFLHPFPYPSPI